MVVKDIEPGDPDPKDDVREYSGLKIVGVVPAGRMRDNRTCPNCNCTLMPLMVAVDTERRFMERRVYGTVDLLRQGDDDRRSKTMKYVAEVSI